MDARALQKRLPIGCPVRIVTKNNTQYAGIVLEHESDFLVLKEANGDESFISYEDISSGKKLEADAPEVKTTSVPSSPVIAIVDEEPSKIVQIVQAIAPPIPQNTQMSDIDIDTEIFKRLRGIGKRFDEGMRSATITVQHADFIFPAEELSGYGPRGEWERIKNMYDYARKMNELGPKHNRVQLIVAGLKELSEKYPSSPSLKRQVVYFLLLMQKVEKLPEALKYCKQAAVLSNSASDWHNVAALAKEVQDDALMCYSLNQLFKQKAINSDITIWYLYILSIYKLEDYVLLRRFLDAGRRTLSAEEEQLLFEAALYILLSSEREQAAQELMCQQIKGSPISTLVQDACKYFQYSLSDEYQKIEAEFVSLAAPRPSPTPPPSQAPLLVPLLEAPVMKPVYSPPLRMASPPSRAPMPSPSKTAVPIHNKYELAPQYTEGAIYTYKAKGSYGFLYGANGDNYFFHRSAVSDIDLLAYLEQIDEKPLSDSKRIPVYFEIAQGPKGPLAVRVWSTSSVSQNSGVAYRERAGFDTSSGPLRANGTLIIEGDEEQAGEASYGTASTTQEQAQTVDKIFALANRFAETGKHLQAITQIKRVLALDSSYPGAKQLYDQLREYVSFASLPTGSNPYARAKHALMRKDLEEAADLFYTAIRQNDRKETAVKDLAVLLLRLNRGHEAIKVLTQYRQQMKDQEAIESLLIQAYQKVEQYAQAIVLMQKKFNSASTRVNRASLCWLIANNYLRLEQFTSAQQWFQRVIDQRIEGRVVAAQISVALCLIKQQQYDKAEEMLNKTPLLDAPAEVQEQVATLLEEVRKLKMTGRSGRIDEIINETYLSDFSIGISGFANFFLERCEYDGVAPAHVQSKTFDNNTIRQLIELAEKVGPRNPRERAEYYLSAAQIVSELDDIDDQYQLYLYLCRSFTSRGDAAVQNGLLDVVRDWYCEALHMYDGDLSGSRDDQDAYCALVRYLYSTLDIKLIPINKAPLIDNTLRDVFEFQSDPVKVFDAITYLMSCSQYAANRILGRLYRTPEYKKLALTYLRSKGYAIVEESATQEEFIHLWDEPRRKMRNEFRTILIELRPLARVDITPASIESRIRTLRDVGQHLFFDLDKQRVEQLQSILEAAQDLCGQDAFEGQDRFCTRIDTLCQNLLQEIEASPTRISVEGLYPIIAAVQGKTRAKREEIYKVSEPQLTIRAAVESYVPDDNQRVEVQIVVANKLGCSPAESLELIVQVDQEESFFTTVASEVKLNGSLRGGEQKILVVPIQVTEIALIAQSFSLPIYVQYRTLSAEKMLTTSASFSIRLYASTQFVKIANPYARYANGGVVGDDMFYGRTELIANIADAICKERSQSKSIVIFGQKRSGKSSILYHLEKKLKQEDDLLVVNIENIGALMDEKSSVALLYQILWAILNKLQFVIEDEILEKGRPIFSLPFPNDTQFYTHLSPLTFFRDLLTLFKRTAARTPGWEKVHVVLLIDEFSYVYGKIISGQLSEDFMKNWKALLQNNFFSVVLVGQDVMPKFIQRFPNDFAAMQDIRVNYLEEEEARRLIDEPIRLGEGKSRYREKAIERILDLTAGSPFYIQIICSRLVEYMNSERAELVTYADVDNVKNALIDSAKPNPLEWNHFDNLVSSGDNSPDAISDEDAIKVLKVIAKNSRAGSCSLDTVLNNVEKTVCPVKVILLDLEKRQVIECKEGQYYRIRVGLFKEWLTARY